MAIAQTNRNLKNKPILNKADSFITYKNASTSGGQNSILYSRLAITIANQARQSVRSGEKLPETNVQQRHKKQALSRNFKKDFNNVPINKTIFLILRSKHIFTPYEKSYE